MDEVKKELPETKEEKDTRTPEQKVQDILKDFSFIKFTNGKFFVEHTEMTQVLDPKIFTMGDLSEQGRILSNLNGGAPVSAIDAETFALNTSLANIQTGFKDFKFDLLKVEDVDLINALYLAIKSYNLFFRKAPSGASPRS